MGLRLVPYFFRVSGETEEPLIYAVDGFPASHVCLIGSAGVHLNGKRRWYVHWYRNTVRIPAIVGLYDSPEQALEVAAEFWEAQTERDPDWR